MADFRGPWHNQHRSEMWLEVADDGRVTGEYVTKVGAPGDEERFPLVGFVAGDLISFTVNFGRYGSLTAWAGQLTKDRTGERLDSFWHLAKNIPDEQEKEKLWASMLTGMDVFRRGEAPDEQLYDKRLPSYPLEIRAR